MKEDTIPKKTKGNYCFPNILAASMRNVSQRIQYEASIMSIVVILLGLIALGTYSVFFTNLSFFVKMMSILNMGAAFVFLSSNLVTSYQQYYNFLEVMDLLETHNQLEEPNQSIELNENVQDII